MRTAKSARTQELLLALLKTARAVATTTTRPTLVVPELLLEYVLTNTTANRNWSPQTQLTFEGKISTRGGEGGGGAFQRRWQLCVPRETPPPTPAQPTAMSPWRV